MFGKLLILLLTFSMNCFAQRDKKLCEANLKSLDPNQTVSAEFATSFEKNFHQLLPLCYIEHSNMIDHGFAFNPNLEAKEENVEGIKEKICGDVNYISFYTRAYSHSDEGYKVFKEYMKENRKILNSKEGREVKKQMERDFLSASLSKDIADFLQVELYNISFFEGTREGDIKSRRLYQLSLNDLIRDGKLDKDLIKSKLICAFRNQGGLDLHHVCLNKNFQIELDKILNKLLNEKTLKLIDPKTKKIGLGNLNDALAINRDRKFEKIKHRDVAQVNNFVRKFKDSCSFVRNQILECQEDLKFAFNKFKIPLDKSSNQVANLESNCKYLKELVGYRKFVDNKQQELYIQQHRYLRFSGLKDKNDCKSFTDDASLENCDFYFNNKYLFHSSHAYVSNDRSGKAIVSEPKGHFLTTMSNGDVLQAQCEKSLNNISISHNDYNKNQAEMLENRNSLIPFFSHQRFKKDVMNVSNDFFTNCFNADADAYYDNLTSDGKGTQVQFDHRNNTFVHFLKQFGANIKGEFTKTPMTFKKENVISNIMVDYRNDIRGGLISRLKQLNEMGFNSNSTNSALTREIINDQIRVDKGLANFDYEKYENKDKIKEIDPYIYFFDLMCERIKTSGTRKVYLDAAYSAVDLGELLFVAAPPPVSLAYEASAFLFKRYTEYQKMQEEIKKRQGELVDFMQSANFLPTQTEHLKNKLSYLDQKMKEYENEIASLGNTGSILIEAATLGLSGVDAATFIQKRMVNYSLNIPNNVVEIDRVIKCSDPEDVKKKVDILDKNLANYDQELSKIIEKNKNKATPPTNQIVTTPSSSGRVSGFVPNKSETLIHASGNKILVTLPRGKVSVLDLSPEDINQLDPKDQYTLLSTLNAPFISDIKGAENFSFSGLELEVQKRNLTSVSQLYRSSTFHEDQIIEEFIEKIKRSYPDSIVRDQKVREFKLIVAKNKKIRDPLNYNLNEKYGLEYLTKTGTKFENTQLYTSTGRHGGYVVTPLKISNPGKKGATLYNFKDGKPTIEPLNQIYSTGGNQFSFFKKNGIFNFSSKHSKVDILNETKVIIKDGNFFIKDPTTKQLIFIRELDESELLASKTILAESLEIEKEQLLKGTPGLIAAYTLSPLNKLAFDLKKLNPDLKIIVCETCTSSIGARAYFDGSNLVLSESVAKSIDNGTIPHEVNHLYRRSMSEKNITKFKNPFMDFNPLTNESMLAVKAQDPNKVVISAYSNEYGIGYQSYQAMEEVPTHMLNIKRDLRYIKELSQANNLKIYDVDLLSSRLLRSELLARQNAAVSQAAMLHLEKYLPGSKIVDLDKKTSQIIASDGTVIMTFTKGDPPLIKMNLNFDHTKENIDDFISKNDLLYPTNHPSTEGYKIKSTKDKIVLGKQGETAFSVDYQFIPVGPERDAIFDLFSRNNNPETRLEFLKNKIDYRIQTNKLLANQLSAARAQSDLLEKKLIDLNGDQNELLKITEFKELDLMVSSIAGKSKVFERGMKLRDEVTADGERISMVLKKNEATGKYEFTKHEAINPNEKNQVQKNSMNPSKNFQLDEVLHAISSGDPVIEQVIDLEIENANYPVHLVLVENSNKPGLFTVDTEELMRQIPEGLSTIAVTKVMQDLNNMLTKETEGAEITIEFKENPIEVTQKEYEVYAKKWNKIQEIPAENGRDKLREHFNKFLKENGENQNIFLGLDGRPIASFEEYLKVVRSTSMPKEGSKDDAFQDIRSFLKNNPSQDAFLDRGLVLTDKIKDNFYSNKPLSTEEKVEFDSWIKEFNKKNPEKTLFKNDLGGPAANYSEARNWLFNMPLNNIRDSKESILDQIAFKYSEFKNPPRVFSEYKNFIENAQNPEALFLAFKMREMILKGGIRFPD